MTEVFVDAWFMIAMIDSADQHHRNALRLRERLRAAIMVTQEAILIELLAFFSGEGEQARRAAVNSVRDARSGWTVVSIDRPLFDRSLALYAARPDKEYSLTDCMSMVVMRDRGIEHVLTNDHHFRQEGFTVLAE